MKMLTKLAFAASLLLTIVQSKLSVYGPDDLKREFEFTGGEVQSVVANFGHVPYGQVMVRLKSISFRKYCSFTLALFPCTFCHH